MTRHSWAQPKGGVRKETHACAAPAFTPVGNLTILPINASSFWNFGVWSSHCAPEQRAEPEVQAGVADGRALAGLGLLAPLLSCSLHLHSGPQDLLIAQVVSHKPAWRSQVWKQSHPGGFTERCLTAVATLWEASTYSCYKLGTMAWENLCLHDMLWPCSPSRRWFFLAATNYLRCALAAVQFLLALVDSVDTAAGPSMHKTCFWWRAVTPCYHDAALGNRAFFFSPQWVILCCRNVSKKSGEKKQKSGNKFRCQPKGQTGLEEKTLT